MILGLGRGDVVQVVEYLPSKQKALSSNPIQIFPGKKKKKRISFLKLGVVAHACNPRVLQRKGITCSRPICAT
jgi:hypothetical protein